ncbi:MAG: hypothetical protein N3A57_04460 [Negativicutes bacterium]|nr:hypothetical protein [Negativicutes bacterium]
MGVFVYRPGAGREMVIVVDYVIAEFRDYKTGQFIHEKLAAFVIQGQYDCLALERDIAGSMHADHRRYIGKIGYRQDGDGVWRLDRRTLAARYCRG